VQKLLSTVSLLVAFPTLTNWVRLQPFRPCFYTYDIYGLLCYISINRSCSVPVLSHFIVTQSCGTYQSIYVQSRRRGSAYFSAASCTIKEKIGHKISWQSIQLIKLQLLIHQLLQNHYFHGNISAQGTTGATAQLNCTCTATSS
jgi:hypothetical protein